MLIRVKGTVNKIVHRGESLTTILVQTSRGKQIVLRASNGTDYADEVKIGQELDVICKIAVFTKETEYATFYDNSIYIIDRYPNIDEVGGELYETERGKENRRF